MVAAYVCARYTMGTAANRQRIYHDKDTATCFFKAGDWVLYWTGPFFVVEKVSPVDYIIQFSIVMN